MAPAPNMGLMMAPFGRPQGGAGTAGGASRLRRAAVEGFAHGLPRRRDREWRHEGWGMKPATSEGPRGSSTGGLEGPKISSPMSGMATAGRPKRMRWSARAQRSVRPDQTKTTLTDFDQTKTTTDRLRPRRRDQTKTTRPRRDRRCRGSSLDALRRLRRTTPAEVYRNWSDSVNPNRDPRKQHRASWVSSRFNKAHLSVLKAPRRRRKKRIRLESRI